MNGRRGDTKLKKKAASTIDTDERLSHRRYFWLIFAILLATLAYLPSLKYGFVFDDVQQIVENPAVKGWSYLPQYFTAHVGAGSFPNVRGSFYRPLFLVWLRLNYLLFGANAWGYHFTSILLHLTAIWVFFILVGSLTPDRAVVGWATLLFALHPIHIESVVWISAVPEIQFSIAGMAAIYAYLRYRREERTIFLCLAAALYAIGLLAKETALIIWPLMAAADWWDTEVRVRTPVSTGLAALKTQIPFAAITAAYFALRFHALHGIAGEATHTFSEIVCAAPSVILFYLEKLLAPLALSQLYFYAETFSFASAHFVLSLLAVCAVTLALGYFGRKTALGTFAVLLLMVSLVPPLMGISVFPRHDLMHNRYAYLPSAGACILVALVLRTLSRRLLGQGQRGVLIANGVLGVAALGCVFSIRTQERPYHDNIALFSSAVELAPESAMAWGLLGEQQMTVGQYADGIASFRRAQALEPDAQLNNYRLGAAYYQVQDMADAELYFRRTLDTAKNEDVVSYDYALYRLGLSEYAQGKMAEAESTLQRAVDLEPKGFGYHVALGAALKYQGRLREAKKQFELELGIGPDAEATALLQQVETQLGGSSRGE
ncbi:MAG TPA: tetratricopeptide repeat protein [Candidatus Sulfotelmatobacter sp.]|nr:tetratricopeptide repeat protein [Candidatus Sulfotelmatobacter sp.]